MKKLLFFGILITTIVRIFAAAPTFQSFEPTQFDTNLLGIRYLANWTNELGVIHPATVNTEVTITNMNLFETFVLPSKVKLLTLGTNELNVATNSTWLLASPTNDATQVILSLSAGKYQGQILFITSQNSDGAFKLPDESEQYDVPGALIDLQGDWIATTNRGMILQYTAPDWIEMARFDPGSTNGPFPGNTNLVFGYQELGAGTDFNYTVATATYEPITFGTSGPSFVLTNAGTYQIVMNIPAFDAGTAYQDFYVTNVTDGIFVAGTEHSILVSSSSIDNPLVLPFQVTTTSPNTMFELWGQTHNVTYASAGVLATNFVLDVLQLGAASPGGSGTVTSFSAGTLLDLFTTSVAMPTTTPALTFSPVDPGDDRIVVFDNTDNGYKQAIIGSGLSYDAGTDTLTATGTAFTTGVGVTNISSVLSGNYSPGSNVTFTTNANGNVTIAATGDGTANWTASGTTNSTLAGLATVNLLSVTNYITLGGTTNRVGDDGARLTYNGSPLITFVYPVACSDELSILAAGTNKVTFRSPFAFTLTAVRASLTTAQASGSIITVDFNEAGTSVLSTKVTIDNTEKTSTTAATPPVISDSSIADDAELSIDLDQVGDGTATGLKFEFYGYQ